MLTNFLDSMVISLTNKNYHYTNRCIIIVRRIEKRKILSRTNDPDVNLYRLTSVDEFS